MAAELTTFSFPAAMESRSLLLFAALLTLGVAAEKVQYRNYRVYRVLPTTQEQVKVLRNLESFDGVSFWKVARRFNDTADIMVAPHKAPELLNVFQKHGFHPQVYVDDVQTLIDNERPTKKPAAFGWEDYYDIDDINAWMDSLVSANPGVVSSIVVGTTYEGRQIKGVKVSYKSGNPAVYVEGGIHANEWIGPATVTFILNQLVTSTDPTVRNVAENLDWYVVPVTNVDGYVYTWTNDRMWRKTRSQGSRCIGVDPNRNWDYRWLEEGADTDECSNFYAGSKPFSEIETRSIADYLSQISNLQGFLAFHSYSQLLMYSYGSSADSPDNAEEMDALANRAVTALQQRYGTQYRVGAIWNTIYPATGGSIDWVKKVLNPRFAFIWELRDTGHYGDLLPTDQIIPSGEETMDSVVVVAQELLA